MATPEIAQVVMDANTVTTISNNINSLYSNAISQLTAYTLGVVALVGILIPALVTLIQWRSLKAEKENLELHITNEMTKVKASVRDELINELKTLIQSEEIKLFSRIEEKFEVVENQLLCASASAFHLQGNTNKSKNYHGLAVEDYCVATRDYLSGKDELNGQTTLKLIIDDCLPNIDREIFETCELDEKLNELVDFLKQINQNNRYTNQISSINSGRKAAMARDKKPAAIATK